MNYTIYTNADKEKIERVQRLAFALGYKWSSDDYKPFEMMNDPNIHSISLYDSPPPQFDHVMMRCLKPCSQCVNVIFCSSFISNKIPLSIEGLESMLRQKIKESLEINSIIEETGE